MRSASTSCSSVSTAFQSTTVTAYVLGGGLPARFRAWVLHDPVLLFDEPTAHLDPATAEALATELLTATAERTTLIVTHRPEHVPNLPEVRLGRVRTFGPADPICVGASSNTRTQ